MNFGFCFSCSIFFLLLVQATIGFGFPMIATPLLAMMTDMKAAVIYVAIPTLLLNISALISEGNFLQTIKQILSFEAFDGNVWKCYQHKFCFYSNSEILKLSYFYYFLSFSQNYHLKCLGKKKPNLSPLIFGLLIIGG